MRKRSRYGRENESELLASRLVVRELESVSDCLYFSAVCQEEYPELSELFDSFGRAHADNMKCLEKVLSGLGAKYLQNIRANAKGLSECKADDMVEYLVSAENENILLYEKLYLIDKTGAFDVPLKEILRASKERLSILENILKT